MEVVRNFAPEDNFLHKVRKLATDRNIVLIFDECTSGFRETFGGIYQKYGVEPDMAMYGKTIGNGYALTAVVGKKEQENGTVAVRFFGSEDQKIMTVEELIEMVNNENKKYF